jgi:2-iminoacetate synthase
MLHYKPLVEQVKDVHARYSHDHEEVERRLIDSGSLPTRSELNGVLGRASALEPLSLQDAALLVRTKNSPALAADVLAVANHVRRQIFGDEVKFYVPVYITNVCVNNCTYCGFRRDNTDLKRILLDPAAFTKEVAYLLDLGHRHIEIVLGYHPKITNGRTLAEYVEPVHQMLARQQGGTIILMSEPMPQQDYADVAQAGVTEVYSWQETYHPGLYRSLHPHGTHKADQAWRYQLFDRAIGAGIGRIGMGVLSGLYDWAYDELSLARHALWIRNVHGFDPYAFGVPRFKPGDGIPMQAAGFEVDDFHYKLSIAIRRLMFPRTHTYMNSREDLSLLVELLNCGGTEINAEASTVPGGYTRHSAVGAQFFHYSFNSAEVFETLRSAGFAPTFEEVSPRK